MAFSTSNIGAAEMRVWDYQNVTRNNHVPRDRNTTRQFPRPLEPLPNRGVIALT